MRHCIIHPFLIVHIILLIDLGTLPATSTGWHPVIFEKFGGRNRAQTGLEAGAPPRAVPGGTG